MSRIPILLASDFPILRDSLKVQFENSAKVELVGCANDRAEVIPLVESFRPKLVLLDLNLDWNDLCVLLDDIHSTSDARSLIMSDELDTSHVIRVLRHGANGVLSRRTSQELFTKSIVSVLAGHFWVSRAVMTDFVKIIRQNSSAEIPGTASVPVAVDNPAKSAAADTSRFALTPRETQIIGALADGQTNKDIASTFGISEYTVKHHLTNIYDKLGVYNRVELVIFAMNHGLCVVPEPAVPTET